MILDNVDDHNELSACCLSSSVLRSYAQERLFTSIILDASYERPNLATLRDCFTATTLAMHVRAVSVTGDVDSESPYGATPLLSEIFWLLSAAGQIPGGTEHTLHRRLPGPGFSSMTSLKLLNLNISEVEIVDIVRSFPSLKILSLFMCRLHEEDHSGMQSRMTVHGTTPCLTETSFVWTSPSDALIDALFPTSTSIALRSMLFEYAQVSHSTVQSLVTRAGTSLEEFTFVWAIIGQRWELSGKYETSYGILHD